MAIFEQIQSHHLLIFTLVVIGVYYYFTYMYKEGMSNVVLPGIYESLDNVVEDNVVEETAPQVAPPTLSENSRFVGGKVFGIDNPDLAMADVVTSKQQLNADDLLPKYDEANEFAKQNPVANLLSEQNFLVSGYHIGVDTVTQSNKIAYHDLRSAPPVPKVQVGPWSQSSYETPAGSGRRQLEIGFA